MTEDGGVLQPWTCDHCGQPNAGPAPCSACFNAAPPGVSATLAAPATNDRPALRRALAALVAVLLVAGLAGAAFHEPGTTDRQLTADARGVTAGRSAELTPTPSPARKPPTSNGPSPP